MGLQIPYRIGASGIHGQGVFSLTPLERGSLLWRFEPGFDRAVRLEGLPERQCRDLLHYGYTNPRRPGWVIVCGDNARFWNFPPPGEPANAVLSPRTVQGEHLVIAARRIESGEELLIEPASDADYARKLRHLLSPLPVAAAAHSQPRRRNISISATARATISASTAR
ncbi:SET domain-containing protein [Cyanobium sp. ATX 6A2]|jgi:hypothetical protein|uniref:SET domain-containing protein n=1 Tax=Cyanobium sp. ATX 6A2 TaxID=2823700 RepID=UPI0020CDAC44|nr:SET domain-containing protein [Cyanobium sp. ATX 6A2]MCP9887334.1 SET domain-containing protein [Cyanobium sp. ATX 6A2]